MPEQEPLAAGNKDLRAWLDTLPPGVFDVSSDTDLSEMVEVIGTKTLQRRIEPVSTPAEDLSEE